MSSTSWPDAPARRRAELETQAFDVVRKEGYPWRRTYVRQRNPDLGDGMLTPRQQEIWQFLVEYADGHGYPPTVREIGEADRKSTRLNSSHIQKSRMPSSA